MAVKKEAALGAHTQHLGRVLALGKGWPSERSADVGPEGSQPMARPMSGSNQSMFPGLAMSTSTNWRVEGLPAGKAVAPHRRAGHRSRAGFGGPQTPCPQQEAKTISCGGECHPQGL